MANRKESAADIVVTVGDTEETVESLSLTKNVDVESIHGSNATLPAGYAINQVSYEGEMTLKGDRTDLESKFFDTNGIPKVLDSISVTHLDGGSTNYFDILLTSEGYEMNAGESTETTYEFIAMSRGQDNQVDYDPDN